MVDDGWFDARDNDRAGLGDWIVNRRKFPNGLLDYRFLSAMQGALGIGANLDKWSDAEAATASRWIARYKTIRETVQRGALYRLISPTPEMELSATLYVAPDRRRAVLFAMLHSSMWRDNRPAIQPRGLDADRRYAMRTLDGSPLPAGMPARASGAFWMQRGVRLALKGDFVGLGLVFDRVDRARRPERSPPSGEGGVGAHQS